VPTTSLRVQVLECPSGQDPKRQDADPAVTPWTPIVAITDYAVTIGVDPRLQTVVPSVVVGQGIMPKNSETQFSQVSDGLSNTIAIVESSGRPLVYRRGPLLVNSDPTISRVQGGGWSRAATDLLFAGSNKAGTVIPGTSVMNSTNGDDIASHTYPDPYYGVEGTSQPFAFHNSGQNILFGDGRVKFLDENIDITIFSALVTRDKAEALSDGSY
jgi:hypothetical protein